MWPVTDGNNMTQEKLWLECELHPQSCGYYLKGNRKQIITFK